MVIQVLTKDLAVMKMGRYGYFYGGILLVILLKVKRRRIWFLITVAIIIAGVKIHDRIINSVFNGFETEMCRTYSEIKNIELRIINGGSVCIIDVDLKEEI